MWRGVRYAIVSALGAGVQFSVVAALTIGTSLTPTTVAIASTSAAVVHNFVWHQRWTWSDRVTRRGGILRGLVLYAGSNGAVSIVINVLSATTLAGLPDVPHWGPLGATAIGIAAAGLLNYWMAGRVVWRPAGGYGVRLAGGRT